MDLGDIPRLDDDVVCQVNATFDRLRYPHGEGARHPLRRLEEGGWER